MSRRGDNIRKRKDGRWEGRYIFSKDSTGKSLYKSVYGKTYSEVKEKLIIETKNVKPKLIVSDCKTVGDIANEWLQIIKQSRKYSTFIKYSYIYFNHIEKHVRDKKINEVTSHDCSLILEREYYNVDDNQKEHLSKSTLNSIKNVLTQIMEYGNHSVFISNTINTPTNFSQNNRSRVTVFSREEQFKLQYFLTSEPSSYNLGIYLCMFTGLRLGEICALETNSINLDRRIIRVTQTVQRIKSEGLETKTKLMLSQPKTAHSTREIPICDLLFKLLKTHMPQSQYLVNGNKIMEPRTYQYFFQKVLKALSIEPKNFHTLRHTFATNCIGSGMDPKCLSEILGHSDVKTTLNKYVHPTLEQQMEQLNSFASNYGQFDGQF